MAGAGLELLVCSLHGTALRLQLAVQLTLVAELTDKLCGNFTYVVGITVNYNLNHNLAPQIRMLNPCSRLQGSIVYSMLIHCVLHLAQALSHSF